MGRLLTAFKSSKLLQFGTPAVLLLVVAVSVAVVMTTGSPNEEASQAEQQLVTVNYGTFATDVPVDGTIVYPNRRFLTFESAGIVGEILATEGQRVNQDDILVTFDPLRIASLEHSVAQEDLSLSTARANLNALTVANPARIAQAEAVLIDAAIEVDDAREALEDVTDPTALQVGLAEQLVANSNKSLDEAREFLEDLLTPEEIDISNAEKLVAAAKVEVDAAEEAYDDIKDGSFPEDVIRDARNQLDFAETQLESAQKTFEDAQLEWDNNVRFARDDRDEASEEYNDLYRYWLGITLTEDELRLEPDELFETWNADLDELFDRKNPRYQSRIPPVDNPTTRWNDFTVWAWLNLYPGGASIQGSCDINELLGVATTCLSREFDDLFDVYDDALDSFEETENNAVKIVSGAQDAVTAAEDAVADALEDWEDIEDGPDASQIEDADKRLRLARANLVELEEDLSELVADIDPLDVAQAESNFAVAQAAFDDAVEDLDDLVFIIDPLKIEQARKRLIIAETNLATARLGLEDAKRIHASELALAQASVSLASEGTEDAMEDFEGALIRAPFDGIVSLVNVDVDDEVNDESRVVEVIDPSVVEVVGAIDASNIGFIREGSIARVSISALQNQEFQGVVTFVANQPRTERGVVTYPVRIQVNMPQQTLLPSGLTGVTASIIGQETGVILVPKDAIARNEANHPVVNIMRNGEVVEQPVVPGESNESWAIIRSGLNQGEQILVKASGLENPSVQLSRAITIQDNVVSAN